MSLYFRKLSSGGMVPLIAWGYAGFAGGLIAGFSDPWLCLAGGAALIWWGVYRPGPASLGVLLLFWAGALLAGADHTKPRRYGSAPAVGTPGILASQRARASRAIDSVFLGDAPLAKALLVADQSEIPKPVRDRYAAAGIIHMLSISGLHVAIIAAVVDLLFHVVRLPRTIASGVTVAIITLYVAVIGFPPPAVRSGAMLAVTAASRAAQRPTSPWAVLAIGGIVPLCIDLRSVLDVGYQLSVGGIAGLIASGALARRIVDPYCSGWRRSIARGVLASSVATVVSAPLAAWSFGRISMVAPLTNLVADPILAIAQPILFVALVLAPVRVVARFCAAAVHPLLLAFDAVAAYGAAIPGGSIAVHPTVLVALLSGVATVCIIVACVSRFPARPAIVAITALCAAVWVG